MRNDNERSKVAVALSGGVDSSTAAALLVEQGFQVVGLTMRLWASPPGGTSGDDHCGSEAAHAAARRVCELLHIPFHLIDMEAAFKTRVMDYFCDSYARGRTPNPCVVCNRYIKFDALLTIAREMGADRLATGHYARVRTTQGKYQLLKGLDAAKDQSYVLYTLGQNRLPYLIFPLGTHTKTEVRAMAEQRSLPTANRPESQDVCWVKGGDYRDFLAEQRPETSNPGPILDVQGRVLGQHRGIAFYTVGQRHGLGVAAPQPLYVTRISATSNAVFVGPKEAVLSSELLATDVLFVSGDPPACPVQITAKIRYKARESSATLVPLAGRTAQVIFSEPQPAITPGQAVVFYQDDVVLGGGVIS